MFVTCGFAGCATFSINKVKYYNEVLATVGDTEITRHELLVAYNSYGYSYYANQNGQGETDALKSTLDLLIDRESLYQYARDNDSIYRPSEYQVNNAINEMFDSLDSSMEDYISRAKNILDIESEDIKDEEDTEPTEYSLDDYKYVKRAEVKYNNNKYYIEYIVEDEPAFDSLIATRDLLSDFENSDIIAEIKTAYLTKLSEDIADEEGTNASAIESKAIKLFVSDLMDYEEYLRDKNGKAYNTKTDDLIYRYFERSFESQIKSVYLENIRTTYLETEELSLTKLIDKYNAMVNKNYSMYLHDEVDYKDDMKNIGTDGDTILYHPTMSDGTEFGYFIHTLINFSEDQKTAIKNLDNILDEELRQQTYESIIGETVVTKRSYDEESNSYVEGDETSTLSEVIAEYNNIYNRPNDYDINKPEDSKKLRAFIDFMFTYTGDTGTMSAGMPYVVGTNGYSAMETAFTNESIKLMDTGVDGAMSKVDITNTDSMCITSYGIHLVMFMGDVDSFDIARGENVYIQSTDKSDDINGDLNLYTKILNPLTEETYFDMLFDTVYPASGDEVYTSNTGYSDEEERIVSNIQKKYPVVKYTTKINATKVSI